MTEPSRQQKLDSILHAYLQGVDAGKPQDREVLLRQHPELAAELREFFADQEKMDHFARSMHKAQLDVATIGLDGSPAPEQALPRVRYFGDYELLEEIARGGMGVVYKAKQVSLNRLVALKMILKGELANDADVQRFRAEAETAANLDHPNIVPIYEIGAHEGQQYFSMKLIGPGQRRADLGVQEAVRLTALVARAVHHAHQCGVLHRDLKPSNFLFDEQGEPHVADFGLAKRVGGDSGTTRSGAIVGTPSYMAPEQARAEKGLSTAADVYSMGAILFEWLTGQPPFRGTDVMSTMMMVIANAPPRPRLLNRKIDLDLETICLKCLDKERGKRYASAEALAEDLDRWQQGKPILARRIGRVKRVWRWCRRKPALAAVTFLALISSFAALALLIFGYIVQNEHYCQIMLHSLELLRKAGRLDDARREFRRAKDYKWFGLDERWRGAALQIAAEPELHPLRQVKIGDEPRNVPLHAIMEKVRIEWEDASQVRVSAGKDVQTWRLSDADIVAGKQANDSSQFAPRLNESSPKVKASIPKDAVLLGRSANDAWAVLRLAPSPGREGEEVRATGNGRIVLWDVDKKTERHELPEVGKLPVFVLVSPDGGRMAYVDPFFRHNLRLWDWERARFSAVIDMGAAMARDEGPASLGGFSPDGEMLITHGVQENMNYLLIWQAETGRLLSRVYSEGASCQWSPDSRKLAIVGRAAVAVAILGGHGPGIFLQFWEMRYPSRSYAINSPTNAPTFSADGRHLAWGGQFFKIGSRGDDRILEFLEPERDLAQFAADGSRWQISFKTANDGNQTLIAQRLQPDPLTRTLLFEGSKIPAGGKGESRQMVHVRMSSDGKHALISTRSVEHKPSADPVYGLECLLEWWDLVEGKRRAIWNESTPERGLFKITLAADGRFAVTRTYFFDYAKSEFVADYKVWDLPGGTVKKTMPIPFGWMTAGICFSADRRQLCHYSTTDHSDEKARSRKTLSSQFHSENSVLEIHDIATNQRSRRLELRDAQGSRDMTPRAFDLETGWLVTAGGYYVELWDLNTGKPWALWQPHEGAVGDAALSPDGKLLVTTSGNAIRLWPLPYLRQEVDKLERD